MGRRWGKTLMAGSAGLSCAEAGAAVAWVVPTYKNARPVWRFCERLVGHLDGIVTVNRTERVIEFPRGGWLAVYSADNDVGLRGEAFDLVIIDEAAQVGEDTFTDVILPTLADRDGRCILISTPKGRNWFWREWQAAKSDGKDRAAFQAPSSANPMPTIKRAAEMARARVSDRTYRQEWLAEFVDDGGGVFRGVRVAAVSERQVGAEEHHAYVFGVDWGRTGDFTVISVIDATLKRQVAQERFTDVDYAIQTSRLRALAEGFKPDTIIAEANAMGGPLVEQLQRMALPVQPFTTTNASKAEAVDALALAFERGDLSILPDEQLIAELEAFESDRSPSGLIRYGAPAGMHDDCVMALALAWQGTLSGRVERAASLW